jgi:hypothetical protein
VIGDSVTSIGEYAFYNCSKLTSVVIGDSVTSIGEYAFQYCSSLTSVYINDLSNWCNITFEGSYVDSYYHNNPLYYTNNLYVNGELVTELVIPNDVITIKNYAFYCLDGITSVVIGNSVTSIGYKAFSGCSSLAEVYYNGSAAEWNSIYIHYYDNDPLKNATRYYYSESHPIEEGNFWHWVDGVPTIWCNDVSNIVIDAAIAPTCTETGLTKGYHCLTCGYVFEQNVIPATGHGKYITPTFEGENLLFTTTNSTNYPFIISGDTITSTNKDHTSSSTFTITAIKDFVLELEYLVSSESNYDWLTIKHNSQQLVRVSGTNVTSYTALSVNMAAGDTVTITYSKDGSNSNGSDCAYVRILTDNLVYITEDNCADFASCKEDIYCDICGELAIEKIEHSYVDGVCEFCVTPDEYFEFTLLENGTYSIKAKNAQNMPSEIVIPSKYNGNAVTVIGYDAFYGCADITSITIPNGITVIENYAFAGCGISSMVIPNSVTTIGSSAFSSCTSITNVDIPDSITYIGESAFAFCSSLDNVIIPNSVTYIGDLAFYDCVNLTSVEISDNITYISSSMFENCSNLTNVTIPNSITAIGSSAFKDCDSLTDIVIPNSVTFINSSAFYSCYNLANVVIGDSVTTIDVYAFEYCYNLTSIVIGKSVVSINNSAFRDCNSLNCVYYNEVSRDSLKIYFSFYNSPLLDATSYYYRENQPTEEGNFWHWVDGEVKIWE